MRIGQVMVLHGKGARLDSRGGEARAADSARSRLSLLGRCEASICLVAAIAVALGFSTTDAAEPLGRTAIAAPARGELKLSIAAQPINDALNEFARQSGLQVFFLASDQTRQLISTAISGTFEPKAALTRLLSNTGLSFKYLDARSVAIVDPAADTPRPPR
jgi:hemoglobin/transferrin/lactoferrin receptor protein